MKSIRSFLLILCLACFAGALQGAELAAGNSLEQILPAYNWSWLPARARLDPNQTVRFYADGVAVNPRWFTAKWKVTGPRTVTVITDKGSNEVRLTFNEGLTSYEGVDAKGRASTRGSRLESVDAKAPSPNRPAVATPATPAPAAAASSTSSLAASELVKSNRSNLVFVTTADGAGSGFIAKYGGGTYLITNAHVAAGAKGATFKTLEGMQVEAGAPAVAVGHDIFLMALKQGGNPLETMMKVDENAAIGDEIVVLGNAEGAGVINTIKGRIVGLGPNLVEVDAPFQPGNSGSPIIHLKSGKVVGVATYLTIRKYDSATRAAMKAPVIRRFGYRLDSVKTWQPVTWQNFHAQAADVENVEKLTKDLINFLQDISKEGRVTRGAHTNPVIRGRIDQWLDAKSKRLSPRDAASADQSMISFLKVTCQSDIATVQSRMSYDYFQRQLAEQQKERAEIAEYFGKIIEGLKF